MSSEQWLFSFVSWLPSASKYRKTVARHCDKWSINHTLRSVSQHIHLAGSDWTLYKKRFMSHFDCMAVNSIENAWALNVTHSRTLVRTHHEFSDISNRDDEACYVCLMRFNYVHWMLRSLSLSFFICLLRFPFNLA